MSKEIRKKVSVEGQVRCPLGSYTWTMEASFAYGATPERAGAGALVGNMNGNGRGRRVELSKKRTIEVDPAAEVSYGLALLVYCTQPAVSP